MRERTDKVLKEESLQELQFCKNQVRQELAGQVLRAEKWINHRDR